MKELAELLKSVGFGLPKVPDRWAIQSLLSAASGRDGEFAVNLAVLRSLEKARYSPETVGHFALASKYYCHFTSPIRRYADLLVHRQLDEYLQTGKVRKDEQADLEEVGKRITFTEERAEDAEQELKTVLILQMLSKRLGDEMDCVITGLTNFGIFARCKKFGIEGLIPLAELGGDVWQYNQKGHYVVGQRTGIALTLGRPLKAKIVSVNIAARQLNLSPAQPLVTGGVRPKKLVQHGKAAKGRGKGKRERKRRRGRF
jgi:ribonuclease R